ncbi:hypothetical protein [Demequina sp. NBRC 110055]|uniref:hypothetical protein n=1 Tax=Demequina sp. NBRC 110055 TaxID=1570344 RepID=UPI001186B7EA|nr:hypothetical protein [Demequina sp. NBRC 110055]
MTKLDRATALVLVGAAVFFAASMLGAPPVLLVLYGMGVWLWRLWSRWGPAASLALVLIGWTLAALIALVIAPILPWHFPYTVAGSGVVSTASAVLAPRPMVRLLRPRIPTAALWSSLAGGASWLTALALAHLLPGGSGLSWAVWDDSSLDIWEIRGYQAAGGLVPVEMGNPRPLEHAATASLLPTSSPTDASGTELAAELTAHATHWTLTIVIGCTLAGLLAATVVRSCAPHARTWAMATAAAMSSCVMLAGPATGFFMYRGQVNANLTVALILASLAIALSFRRAPLVAWAALVSAMTLIMLTWTPFAAVPGLLAVAHFGQMRRAVRAGPSTAVLWPVSAIAVFLVFVGLFAMQQFVGLASSSSAGRESAVTTESYLYAPVNWWVTAAIAAVVVSGASAGFSRAREISLNVAVWTLGLVLGGVPLFVARGGFSGELEYYPSRYVQMSTVMLAPIAIAVVAAALVMRRVRSSLFVLGLGAATAVAVIAAPTHPLVDKWRPVPVLIVAGDYFGPDPLVADRIIEYAGASTVKLPLHLDVPWDDPVRRMLSVDTAVEDRSWNTYLRSALRNRRDDGADRACEIGAAAPEGVLIVTSDPSLEHDASEACERPSDLDSVTFVKD